MLRTLLILSFVSYASAAFNDYDGRCYSGDGITLLEDADGVNDTNVNSLTYEECVAWAPLVTTQTAVLRYDFQSLPNGCLLQTYIATNNVVTRRVAYNFYGGNTKECTNINYLDDNGHGYEYRCVQRCNEGCTNALASNYDSSANVDDGSCVAATCECAGGCTDAGFLEYSSTATSDDGSCATPKIEGCTDSNYDEYNSTANYDDGSCETLDLSGQGCGTLKAATSTACAATPERVCVQRVVFN